MIESMAVHLLLTNEIDLDAWRLASAADRQPHHLMTELRDAFSARTLPPLPGRVNLLDKILATLCDVPASWASARVASKQLGDSDIVYSVSEDSTLPMIVWLQLRRRRTKVITQVMNPGRKRMKVLFRLFNANRRIARFTSLTPIALDILRDEYGIIPESRLRLFPMETDVDFFRPVERTRFRDRPLIYSAGMEQRDYLTLATAVADLDVEVEVCAKSPNASTRTRCAFPRPVPSNMRFHPYEWTDYRRMFSEADVVVVPLLPNRYGAGLTTMVEGMACGRVVIVTDPTGLPQELADEGALITVPAQDPVALREAIEKVLANPEMAAEMGEIARRAALDRFSTKYSIDALSAIIRELDPLAG